MSGSGRRRAWRVPVKRGVCRKSGAGGRSPSIDGRSLAHSRKTSTFCCSSRNYVRSAVAPDVLDENERSLDQQLRVLGLIHRAGAPTVTGLLVLGRNIREWLPGAYIQFVRSAGTDLTDDIVDQAVIDGPLRQMLDQTLRVLDAHNAKVVHQADGRHRTGASFPPRALRELVVNAVIHRTYEGTNTPVRINWFTDRLEISSPGGPFGEVTRESFGQPDVIDYRNPGLAEAAFHYGYAQRFGRGFDIVRRSLQDNGNPPMEIVVEPSWVLVRLRPAT